MQATLLKNGLIVDGSNEPAYQGDVLLVGAHIQAINPDTEFLCGYKNLTNVDCNGLVIAPGFIDVHTHDDAAILDTPEMLPKLSQGITTVIVGNCGLSLVPFLSPSTQTAPAPLSLLGRKQFRFSSMTEYVAAIQTAPPALNVAALIGHTALRLQFVVDIKKPAQTQELKSMCQAVHEAMAAGALGVSSGVFYQEAYAANQTELVAVAQAAAQAGGVYVTHIRDELAQIVPALQEAADTAQQAGLPLILSHHKCAGHANWGRTFETLALIDKLASKQEIGLDVYPYTAGSTVLREDLVDGVIEVLITASQPHPDKVGQSLAKIAADWGVTQVEAVKRLQPGGACYFQMREDDVARVIAHPLSMIGSDGLPHDTHPHPRLWGAFPRVLAHYWRDKKLLGLEQAVHKMTGLSARRFNLPKRGLIKAGYHADVVVLNPATIQDTATYQQPKQFSRGIERVWVNGELAYTNETRATGA